MKACPFCGADITIWQGAYDYTFFGCGDPASKRVDDKHCGAVISFRDRNSNGLRGSEAVAAFERRKENPSCA